MSDVIHLMYKGNIEQSAPPTQLYTQPKTKFAATFIGHYNVLDANQFKKVSGEAIDSESVAFRPEVVAISDKPIEKENCYLMRGTIGVSLPHGNILRYGVMCDGVQIDVDVLFGDVNPFENGETVYLAVKKESVHYVIKKNTLGTQGFCALRVLRHTKTVQTEVNMVPDILSVGIDIGTSTTQVIFSKLTMENTSGYFTVPRVSIIDKKVVYKSDVYITPLYNEVMIDTDKVRDIVASEFARAGFTPADTSSGAVIITGESARKENSDAVLQKLSDFAGDFVVSAAGPDMESSCGKGQRRL